MKVLLASLLAFSFSAFSSTQLLEIAADIANTADVSGIQMNKDGSVTVKDIKVKRGDLFFSIAAESETDYQSTCRMLGFDSMLTGPGLNTYAGESGNKVTLTNDGAYLTIKSYGYKIDKVTCVKSGQLKTIVEFDRNANEDGSSKISNIRYFRGDAVFTIAAESDDDYTKACRLLGFEKNLTGPGLNTYAGESGNKIVLNSNGTYNSIKSYGYKIDKLTCYAGAEPTFIIYVGGSRYVRIIP